VKKLVLTITVLIAFGLFFSACKKDEPFVIKVGNEKITKSALSNKLSTMSVDFQKFVATDIGKKRFLDFIAQQSIIIKAAKKAGIEKQVKFKKALENFKNEQQKQFADYKDGLLMDIYLKEISEKIKTSDSEIQNYYNKNKSTFEKPMAYTVRHILVSDKQTAQSVYKRLKNGAKFEQVAKEVSKDITAQNGGLLEHVKQGSLVPEFETVALKLKNNEMSEIIETRYGFHVILKISEQKLLPISFDKAKENIKKTLEKDKFNKWFNKAKENFGVEVNYEVQFSESEQQK
jgi:parvulin-like peptidyl-prolyl isomerase